MYEKDLKYLLEYQTTDKTSFAEYYKSLVNILDKVGGNAAVGVKRRQAISSALYANGRRTNFEQILHLQKMLDEKLGLCPYGLTIKKERQVTRRWLRSSAPEGNVWRIYYDDGTTEEELEPREGMNPNMAALYGATLNLTEQTMALMCSPQPTTERDTTMSTPTIQVVTFINGTPAAQVTNDQIYSAIQKLEERAANFEGMRKKPLALKKELADIDSTIDNLIRLVDDRDALVPKAI